MSRKIRVLVVDDSAFSRQTIKKMLDSDPDIEVIEIASSGIDAMTKAMKLKPDVITLDLEMPDMDGFGFLRWLMQKMPIPVIMVSSYSDMKTVFKALELGAVDFIAKPSRKASAGLRNIEKDLLTKVRGIKGLNMSVLNQNLRLLRQRKEPSEPNISKGRINVVAIGTSTGGPSALQILLKELSGDFPSGIIVSQHMPRGFTGPFAERLDELSAVRVKEAEDGDEVEKGKVLICPGGSHMTLRSRGRKVRVALRKSVYKDKYTPSIDTMMISAAESFGKNTMGVILTGMGSDGKEGMLQIKSKGGYTIAESEETAVVFGMPAVAIKAGSTLKVLPLQGIADEMIKWSAIKGTGRSG